jgi:SAM-dependent methyltransferase
VTIPLARHRIDMTGLDAVAAMLARARGKARGLDIRWVEADIRDYHLDVQYRLIYNSGAPLQHLMDRADHEAALARVREHLAPGGRFVLEAVFPKPDTMYDAEEEEWWSYTDERGRTVRVSGTQRYDHVRQVKHETACRRWHDAEGREITRRAPLALRYVFPREMEALLPYNGLRILDCYGDWDRGPLTDDSEVMIYVCDVRA